MVGEVAVDGYQSGFVMAMMVEGMSWMMGMGWEAKRIRALGRRDVICSAADPSGQQQAIYLAMLDSVTKMRRINDDDV